MSLTIELEDCDLRSSIPDLRFLHLANLIEKDSADTALEETIRQITLWALPVLVAIVFHEVAHGWVPALNDVRLQG